MSEIDWSKAPEGAEYWCEMQWFKTIGGEWLVWCHGVNSWAAPAYKAPDNFSWWGSAVGRPIPQWNGTGLPPVGTVCEVDHEGAWYETTIVGYDPEDGAVIFKTHERCEAPYDGYTTPAWFRPIRTPEQIAAEEREAAIDEMWRVYWQPDVHTAKEALGLLYDAGYRKQEQTK